MPQAPARGMQGLGLVYAADNNNLSARERNTFGGGDEAPQDARACVFSFLKIF